MVTGSTAEDDADAIDLASCQAAIAEGILAGQPLAATSEAVCHLIEAALPGTRVSVRLRVSKAAIFGPGAAPSLSRRYRDLFDPRKGPLNEAQLLNLWDPGACSWREDLRSDPAWAPLRPEIDLEGLAAVYCCPVQSNDSHTGALIVVYWPEPHWPTGRDRRIIHLASVLMGVAVAHGSAERALATAASHDPLTGLPNRTLFLDRLRQALARARRHHSGVAVLFLDLDRFKVINDSLGHAAGDRLLLAAASRLATAVRPEDTVARFGGDEFTVLCEEVDDVGVAQALGDRLAEELSKPFVIAQRRFFVTASMGIALGGVGSRAQELIRDADVAMYRSKERGRNRIEVFDSRLRIRTLQRLDDEAELRRTLDHESLTLHYQPVVDLGSRRPLGMEALLRWRRPDGVDVDPREVVGIAEESGLIQRLGAQVLSRACAQLRALLDDGAVDDGFTVAVNISASQLSDVGLAEMAADCLSGYGLRPDQLRLEVTEATLAEDRSGTLESVGALRDLGVRLWIDDFGSGYSSLTRLPNLPVAGLKVDGSIVAGLRSGVAGATLLRVVANLAGALDLPLIAEGVEDEDQLQFLRGIGTTAGQGWYLGPPTPGDQLAALMRAGSPAPVSDAAARAANGTSGTG